MTEPTKYRLSDGELEPDNIDGYLCYCDEVPGVPPVIEWPEGAESVALVFLDESRRELLPDVEPEWSISRAEALVKEYGRNETK